MVRKWLVSIGIIAVVAVISVLLIFNFRDAPSTIAFQAVGDGSGGAIVAWRDPSGIRAQRLDADGKLLWAGGGLLVQSSKVRVSRAYGGSLALFRLTADGVGGAFLSWQDRTEFPGQIEGPPVDLYTQRIGPDGKLLWGSGIKAGKVEPISMDCLPVVPDGTGGAIFAWNDYRTYFRGLHDDFLRLQRVTPDGRMLWGDEGVLVTTSNPLRGSWPTYTGNQVVAGDGEGGAFAVWSEEDYPSRTHRVHAQRVAADGTLSWPEPVLLKSGGDHPVLSVIRSAEEGEPGGAILSIRLSQAYGDPRPSTTLLRLETNGKQSLLKMGSSLAGVAAAGQGSLVAWRLEEAPQFGPPQERAATLYIQGLTGDGSAAWDEIPVIETEEGQSFGDASFASAGSDTVVVWRLGNIPHNAYGRILGQSLDQGGNKKWDGAGLAVFPDAGLKYQGTPTAIGADTGTIIIASAGRGALRGDMVVAQKLDRDGNRLWRSGIRVDK